MNMTQVLYLMGLSVCGMQGAEKVHSRRKYLLRMLSAYLNGLGGGLMRDVFLLHMYPYALSRDCIVDVLVLIICGVIHSQADKKLTLQYERFFDALAVPIYIFMGADKAMAAGAGPLTVFLSGVSTAIGGGLLASLLNGFPVKDVLKVSSYRLAVVFSTVLYMLLCRHIGQDIAADLLVPVTFVLLSSLDPHWLPRMQAAAPAVHDSDHTLALLIYVQAISECRRSVLGSEQGNHSLRKVSTRMYAHLMRILQRSGKKDTIPQYMCKM